MSNPTPPYANVTTTREHWLAIVEKCARKRSTKSLPSLENELGPGRYKLKSDHLLSLPDDTMRYRLHWRGDAGRHTVIGTFDAGRVRGGKAAALTDECYRFAVEQCKAQGGKVDGIATLEHLLGPGRYKIEPCGLRRDGYVLHILYWKNERATGRTRLGSFDLDGEEAAVIKKRAAERTSSLELGYDELGRKVIRCCAGPNSDMFLPIAVEYECVRGEWLPKPCHDRVAQAFRV